MVENNCKCEAAAVVVTYNRLKLLKENISSLLNQTEPCDIILIDNASTDGTEDYIESLNEERIRYFKMEKNLGGSGGFSYGVYVGESMGYKYLWIMDDDAVPEIDALRSLVTKATCLDNRFSFLASLVYWTDGTIFGMNVPGVKIKNKVKAVDIVKKHNLLPVQTSSFVGCFINTNCSRKCGLPISEFFIYGDDVEYTARLSKAAEAYLDLDSVIIHKAPSTMGADIAIADVDRIERFYYQSRNGMYIARKKGFVAVLKRIRVVCSRFCRIIKADNEQKMKRIKVLIKGSIAGMFFSPKIRYSEENNTESV